MAVALYPLSSPNHNAKRAARSMALGCVISSFITKPQLLATVIPRSNCCVISSFITKPQLRHNSIFS